MKFLTSIATPTLVITHRTRRQTITQTGSMVLTESTLTLELTIPSILTGIEARFRSAIAEVRQSWRNLKAGFNRAVRDAFTPNLAHYCACA